MLFCGNLWTLTAVEVDSLPGFVVVEVEVFSLGVIAVAKVVFVLRCLPADGDCRNDFGCTVIYSRLIL